MKTPRFLTALPFLALVLGAQTLADSQLPDRPAAAVTNYKDAWLPVVGADHSSAIVVSGGTPVTLGPNAGIMLSVGDKYAGGFVTIADVDLSDVPVTNDPETAATMRQMEPTLQSLKANLTSDVDIPDAYALIVSKAPTSSPDAPPLLAVVVQAIGDLKAGATAHLSATLPKISKDESHTWSVLVFDAGREVRSTGMGELLPAYFDRIDAIGLRKRIADRADRRVDAPIAVFRQMPLGLPDPVKAKYHGTTVKVEIKVNVEGRVVSAKPVGPSDPDLWNALDKGFSTWLFIPPVKDGVVAPGSAIIPLKM
jgi:hypothetical protein